MQLRHIPNIISALRLSTVPVLFWLAYAQNQQAFAWLLLVAGLTDALDGWIARRFGWTSATGALLDSIADVSLILVSVFGIWQLHPEVFIDELRVFAAVIGIWSVVHLAALLRYRRLASFHTRLTQVGILLFGIFVMVLLFYEFVPWFFHASAAVCFLGGIESLMMVFLVREWTPDLRSGMFGVLQRRRGSAG